MLIVVICVALFVAGIIIMIKYDKSILLIIGVPSLIFVPTLGMSPISGYEEPVLVQEYELKSVYEPSTYIIEDSGGSVTCKHIIKKSHPEAIESYGKYTYNQNVEVVVTEEGAKPIMKEYLLKAKKTIWTFAVGCDETKYVFYVPEENIEKWQNVHVN